MGDKLSNFSGFLIYLIVTTFTPGPNNIMSMTNAARVGYRKTLGFLAGIVVGFMVVMLICGLLNMALVSVLPQIKSWLNWLGAAYMVYLAIHIVLSKPAAEDAGKTSLNTFLAGFSMQFLNVKVILYGVTIYSTFIVQSYQNPVMIALFAPLLACVGFISISCWAFGGNLFRSFLNKYWIVFNIVMGLLLIYTAIISLIHIK
jgi:threonine/homoserine/homoserine lactone efflux protein